MQDTPETVATKKHRRSAKLSNSLSRTSDLALVTFRWIFFFLNQYLLSLSEQYPMLLLTQENSTVKGRGKGVEKSMRI